MKTKTCCVCNVYISPPLRGPTSSLVQRVVAETEEGGSDTQSQTVEACRESVEAYKVLTVEA